MSVPQITLDDMLLRDQGRVYLTGIQALVRLLIMQRRRDLAAGLNTGGFVSGYRGSPLGGVDLALWRNKAILNEHHITFQPAVNEELAATAVIGSQLSQLQPDPLHDGVFGMWYGKGPGLDRAGDAMKHLNALGASRHGGMLIVVGDDHGAVSSSLAHQCEQAMASWMMPVLHPASVQEYIDFGLLGFALSRFSGLGVGFKALSETVESAVSVSIDPNRPRIVYPDNIEIPPQGLNIMSPEPQLRQEERIHRYKLPAAMAFVRANGVDRVMIDSARARFGIMATGKAYLDVKQALGDLGIDEARTQALGIRLYKVGMPWPLEPQGAREFAADLEEVLVVEEKRSVIEAQLKDILYGLADKERPRIVGKTDETGAPLLPGNGELNSGMVARILAARLGLGENGAARSYLDFLDYKQQRKVKTPLAVRQPFFCSGCPHNVSTKLPEGSRALVGTGCHLMAAFMDRDTSVFLHMGCEGAAWLGMQPFTESNHIFQNLGDGAYVHSGSLAIRQALASDINITYKILYNDAVAMTGGQPLEGGVSVPHLTQQLYHEGVRHIAVVTDEPEKYTHSDGFAPGVTINHRRALDRMQREFRDTPGVTVIVYDQTCAAEKRRRRKRGQFPDPARRVFINELVCEGCGDCNVASNCLSVEPLETEFGRKRVINQSSCNKDYSCADGFCPSFVTVHGGRIRKATAAEANLANGFGDLPMPDPPALDKPYGILVTGIGGTGVITIGQILGMAAYLDGHGVSVLDFTGLAQKGGGVLTHVRIARDPDAGHPARIPPGGADLLLAGDTVVSVGNEAMSTLREGVTRAVVNAKAIPTAETVMRPDAPFDIEAQLSAIVEAVGEDRVDQIDATDVAARLTGDAIAANMFMLGYAFQRATVPVRLDALKRAIELNGVAVEANKRAFDWGRMAAHDPDRLRAIIGPLSDQSQPAPRALGEVIALRVDELTAYQDAGYAERFTRLVEKARRAEDRLGVDHDELTEAVARNFYKLMAYKDEYEVARLYTDGRFKARIESQFEGEFELKFHLAPPLLARRDPDSGRPMKGAFGPWMFRLLKLLAKLRGLRGTVFDPFGYMAERKLERKLICDYERTITKVLGGLTAGNHALAVEIAAAPRAIRGFGPVKARNLKAARARENELLSRFQGGASAAPLAAE
ncbi:MAG: indolepyruvate ferredoxin oxidoreductase family protein [Sphingomonadales bacterium]